MRVSFFIQKRSPARFTLQLTGASQAPQPLAPEDLEPIVIGQGLPLVMYAYRVKSPALRGSYFRPRLLQNVRPNRRPAIDRAQEQEVR